MISWYLILEQNVNKRSINIWFLEVLCVYFLKILILGCSFASSYDASFLTFWRSEFVNYKKKYFATSFWLFEKCYCTIFLLEWPEFPNVCMLSLIIHWLYVDLVKLWSESKHLIACQEFSSAGGTHICIICQTSLM